MAGLTSWLAREAPPAQQRPPIVIANRRRLVLRLLILRLSQARLRKQSNPRGGSRGDRDLARSNALQLVDPVWIADQLLQVPDVWGGRPGLRLKRFVAGGVRLSLRPQEWIVSVGRFNLRVLGDAPKHFVGDLPFAWRARVPIDRLVNQFCLAKPARDTYSVLTKMAGPAAS